MYSALVDEREASITSTPEHLAPVRAALGLARDESYERGLARMMGRPAWVQACIALHDAMALAEFVRALRPGRILEIGTASGTSAAAMLWAMEASGAGRRDDGGPGVWIESFDVEARCYFDPSRAVGSAAPEMVPALASHLRTHVGGAREARGLLSGERFPLAFIDACHNHPWPTLDLLWIAPLLCPGAWVVLHDVAYARILDHKRAREGKPARRSEFGPEALFEAWPGVKVAGDGWTGNIGALRIDDPATLTPDSLGRSLRRPWEVRVPPEIAQIAT